MIGISDYAVNERYVATRGYRNAGEQWVGPGSGGLYLFWRMNGTLPSCRTIELGTPLAEDEQYQRLMISCKFQTALRGIGPVMDDFINAVTVNEESASATTEFI